MNLHNFYILQRSPIHPITTEYPTIHTPQDLFDALLHLWLADTCAPRMREKWNTDNPTLGQCSITAFLAQDIFGGKVYGILRPGGNYHCYNVIGDCVFDLTSEQFGDEILSYEDNPEQFREVHFAKDEKRRRYEELCEKLKVYCRRKRMELTTERLLLRPWRETDAADLFECAKDPAVGPIAGWPVHQSIEDSLFVIQNVLGGSECYAVCLKEDGRVIGCIELMMREKSALTDREDECELGYWIGQAFWGRGLIPEAAKRLIRHGFEDLGMQKIWCGYYDGNTKSSRVQEKMGFQYHHTMENVPVPLLAETRTEHITCLTRERWQEWNDQEETMEFQQIIEKRKSIRTYADTPISQDVLDHILQVGGLAPTSRNLKPCTFHLVRDREVLQKLSKAKKAGAAFAADAAAAIVVAADSEKADTWIEDSSIAMTYMMLAAEEQNLGCCWVQIHLRKDADGRDAEENVREMLGLPERFRVMGVLALGNTVDEQHVKKTGRYEL